MKPNTSPPQVGKTSLYTLDAHQQPQLQGVRCVACGTVAFPPQHYGCEQCGSAELAVVPLAADGAVIASSVVHIHAQPFPPVPFTVAEVRLDAGPVVRALLNGASGDPFGQRVHGVIRDGAAGPEFQFEVNA